jgi:hypothetical protein
MVDIRDYLKTYTNADLKLLYEEFEVLNKSGALPSDGEARKLVDRCLEQSNNQYYVSAVMNDVYYEMASRFYDVI